MDTLVNIISSFETSPGKGIPLGNLTSQLFANIYLHELDWHVKQRLRIRHYVRYCDDFVLLVDSTDQAFALAEQVDTFLQENLSIKLHPNKVLVRTWKQGIDFLGYVLLPHAMILRPKTVQRMVSHITKENATSYLGLCTHADAYELERLLKNKMGGSV